MHNVKVHRTGISLNDVADVVRNGLGEGSSVEPDGDSLKVRKGAGKAVVRMREESGGTAFEVSGQGTWFGVYWAITKMMSERGVAKRTADIIGGAEAFAG
jgi:hypothetical protein